MIAFLIMKTIILLGLAGYQIIITILALRALLPSYLSIQRALIKRNKARPRCTQICVYPRAFMTLTVTQFSLKNSTFVFFDGAAWTPRLRSPSPIMTPGFNPFPSLPTVAEDDRKQFQYRKIDINNKARPLSLEFN